MKIRTGFVSNSSSSSFAILGLVITDEVKEVAKKLANAQYEEQIEEYWCCSKCGVEPSGSKKPKFCEKCGSKMHTATRVHEIEWSNYELFEEALGMSYYDSEYGEVVGFNVDGSTAEEVATFHKKLVEKFGKGKYKIISGEYAC